MIIEAHRGLEITEAQRQRFVELHMVAADEAGLPDEKPFRERLRSHLEFGTRVAMQDSDAESEARTAPTTGGSKEVPA